jgi:CRISPR-associated endonuclease/helicase Cas3
MSGIEFAEFYKAAHGYSPFPWQERLAERALAGDWPATIAIPTGCGKTSVIDVAVFALARQADMPAGERTARLRTFFVVDRRLVVDDVSRHAAKLAEAIDTKSELQWVKEQLLRYGGPRALETAVLRGGMYRSNTWGDVPNQPLVCVSTVDQVGSRLLFRGYGVSDWRRPVDAGLVGSDSLMIVDEAHLSKPFLETVEWVVRYQGEDWRKEQVAPRLKLVQMSATVEDSEDRFGLDAADRECESLMPRLEAIKRAELKECGNVAQAAADEAQRLGKAGAVVVCVVLNTVAAARAAFLELDEKHEAILLTGRIRPYDRDRLMETYLDRMKADRSRENCSQLFVVATQTVEVGADLDFDALVTEAAALDALRQRFGRLNRLGLGGSAPAVVLKPKREKEKDWIYGEALEETWKWLNEFAANEDGGRCIDFGVTRMSELAEREARPGLTVDRGHGPLMFPAHVDAWAQTNPAPAADPAVAPFLHGEKALDDADVQIVWRADLDDTDVEDWPEILAAAPPSTMEAVPLPYGAARRWLAQGGRSALVADVEGVAPGEEEDERPTRIASIWRGEESDPVPLSRLRPGDTVVVRSREGGCDQFGWDPGSEVPVRDVGDLCANERAAAGGGRYRIRVHPEVVFPAGDVEKREELRKAIKVAIEDETTDGLREFLGSVGELAGAAKHVDWEHPRAYLEESGLMLVSRKFGKKEAAGRTVEIDESESDTSSLTARRFLAVHTAGVVTKAREYSEGCGLGDALRAAIGTAAERHDWGKRDERFQRLLDPLWIAGDEFLAKSDRCSRQELVKRQRESGYPKGARHEFASAALAEAAGEWPEGCDAELVLHLIGTHHGYGRALAPVWVDGDGEVRAVLEGRDVAVRGAHRVSQLDSGWTDRYWRLTHRYGWWGLAYLEAILRRADCVQSREEQEKRG